MVFVVKKIFCVLLCFVLVIALVACGDSRELREAKNTVDSIFGIYDSINRAEDEMLLASAERKVQLQESIDTGNELLGVFIEILKMRMTKLSAAELQSLSDYIDARTDERIAQILNNSLR